MDYFHFEPALLIKFPPQIWRFATNYLVTFALGIVFDSYFIFNGLQRLEVANPRFPRRVDVIWYLVVICLTILVRTSHSPAVTHACPSYICPDSVTAPTAITVPENEEEKPRVTTSPSFANRD